MAERQRMVKDVIGMRPIIETSYSKNKMSPDGHTDIMKDRSLIKSMVKKSALKGK